MAMNFDDPRNRSIMEDFERMFQYEIREAQTQEDYGRLVEEFERIMRDLNSDDNSPDGPKARALVTLGRRRPEWDWPVGETPTE